MKIDARVSCLAWLTIMVLILSSCGDVVRIKGTGGGNSAIAKTITSTGTLSNDDVLLVNGTTYDTTHVEVIIDDRVGSMAELQAGQIIDIEGDVNLELSQINANTVYFDTSILGAIEQITGDTIIVLEQEVVIYNDVKMAGENLDSIADLSVNEIVKISAYPLSDGRWVASHIERVMDDANAESIVTGSIVALNDIEKTFLLNGLQINYSDADPATVLANGLPVIVEGQLSEDKTVFNASLLRIRQSEVLDTGSLSETQGFITEFFSPSEFNIDGKKIITDSATIYVDGVPADLSDDVLIEVEGIINTEGNVRATTIIFLAASFTNVNHQQRFFSDTQTLRWNKVEGAQAYRVIVRNSLEQIIEQKTFSASDDNVMTLSNIPLTGVTLKVLLQTQYNDQWLTNRYEFFTQVNNTLDFKLTSHDRRDTFTSTSENFTWTDVSASRYTLELSHGDWSYTQDFLPGITEVTVDNIPNNRVPIGGRLIAQYDNGYTRVVPYWFTGAFNTDLPYAELSSHQHEDTLNDGDVIFTWDDVGADEYELYIWGNGARYSERFLAGVTQAVVPDSSLPNNNSEVLLQVKTRHGDVWQTSDIYRLLVGGDKYAARLTSHQPQEVLSSGKVRFEWSDANADKYVVRLTSGKYKNILHEQAYHGDQQVIELEGLPNNCSHVEFYLWTHHGQFSVRSQMSLVSACEQEAAILINHNHRDTLLSTDVTFEWSDTGAEEYGLSISSLEKELYEGYFDAATHSVTVPGLPANNAQLTVSLSSRFGNGWSFQKYELNSVDEIENATLISPEPRKHVTTEEVTIAWTDVGADEYQVLIQDHKESANFLFNEFFPGDVTSTVMKNFPLDNGHRYILFLYSRHGDGWRRNAYTVCGKKTDPTTITSLCQ